LTEGYKLSIVNHMPTSFGNIRFFTSGPLIQGLGCFPAKSFESSHPQER
jgi:hypothetical protein